MADEKPKGPGSGRTGGPGRLKHSEKEKRGVHLRKDAPGYERVDGKTRKSDTDGTKKTKD